MSANLLRGADKLPCVFYSAAERSESAGLQASPTSPQAAHGVR